jgi:hypothetical protein
LQRTAATVECVGNFVFVSHTMTPG